MNAPKTAVEPDLPFESAWSNLESECAAAGVEIINAEKVRSYPQDHLDTIEVAGRVCAAARREFGSDASLELSVFFDREINDRWLRLGVRLPSYGSDILDRFHSVTDAFDDELCRVSGEISVTSDFGPRQ